jgi:hypothetical protein
MRMIIVVIPVASAIPSVVPSITIAVVIRAMIAPRIVPRVRVRPWTIPRVIPRIVTIPISVAAPSEIYVKIPVTTGIVVAVNIISNIHIYFVVARNNHTVCRIVKLYNPVGIFISLRIARLIVIRRIVIAFNYSYIASAVVGIYIHIYIANRFQRYIAVVSND